MTMSMNRFHLLLLVALSLWMGASAFESHAESFAILPDEKDDGALRGFRDLAVETPLEDGLSFPLPFPSLRYTTWEDLPPAVREVAVNYLSYTKETWNLPGTSEIEDLSWESLSPYQKFGASSIGFDEPTWDCFMNHYDDYYWSELSFDAQQALTYLGHNESSWEKELVVDMEDDYWIEMDDDNDLLQDKKTLTSLCYFEDTWDGVLPLFANRNDEEPVDSSCGEVVYNVFISLLAAHLYVVASPTDNSNPNCQETIVLHDHGGAKAAVNFGSGSSAEDVANVVPGSKQMHVDSFTWNEISSAYSQASAFGDLGMYDIVYNNCFGMALSMAQVVGIDVQNNSTMIDWVVSTIEADAAVSSSILRMSGVTSTIRSFADTFLDGFYANRKK